MFVLLVILFNLKKSELMLSILALFFKVHLSQETKKKLPVVLYFETTPKRIKNKKIVLLPLLLSFR